MSKKRISEITWCFFCGAGLLSSLKWISLLWRVSLNKLQDTWSEKIRKNNPLYTCTEGGSSFVKTTSCLKFPLWLLQNCSILQSWVQDPWMLQPLMPPQDPEH